LDRFGRHLNKPSLDGRDKKYESLPPKKVVPQLHNQITLYLSKNIPPISPDPSAKDFIALLQKRGIPVFGFTSRPRDCWYQTPAPDIDILK
jgi:hypothetical protein